MNRWPTKPLGDVCELVNGAPFKPSDWDGSGLPIIRIQNLNDSAKPFNYTSKTVVEKFRVRPGDTLLSWSGTPGTSFGCFRWNGPEGWLNQHIFNVHLSHEVLPPFFIYQVNSKLDELISKAHGGVGLQHITKGALSSVNVSVPPLVEQQRIVALLDEADELRKLRAQADQRSASLIPALFHEMFGDPLINTRRWPTKELRHLGRVVTGSTPPSANEGMFGGEIPFITPGDLDSNTRQTLRYVTTAGAAAVRTVRNGSTLVCCIGATIGKTDRTWKTSAFNQQINAVEWDGEIDDDFGVVCMKQCSTAVIRQGSQTALPILKKSLFEQIRIPVPPLPLQKEFAERVTDIRALEATQATSRRRSDDLFKSMLHAAFNGDL